MRITLTSVVEDSFPVVVGFDSLVGGANAVWHGRSPAVGEQFFVEIQIEGFDLAADNLQSVALSGCRTASIGPDASGMIRIIGESTTGGGDYVRLRVGDGFIEFEPQSRHEPGVWLELFVKQIALFDMHL